MGGKTLSESAETWRSFRARDDVERGMGVGPQTRRARTGDKQAEECSVTYKEAEYQEMKFKFWRRCYVN